MDNKDLAIVAALAKSIGGGGSSTPIPTPTAQDVGKVPKVNEDGEYELAIDEGQSTFAGLTDTTITNPSNGQIPVFNGTTNKWENKDNYVIFKCGNFVNDAMADLINCTYTDIQTALDAGKIVYLDSDYNYQRYYAIYDHSAANQVKFFGVVNGVIKQVTVQSSIPAKALLTNYVVKSWNDITGTLTAGQTSITLSDNSITSDSTIQVFTNTGVNYTAISVSTGSITLTYGEQSTDVNVKVRVS